MKYLIPPILLLISFNLYSSDRVAQHEKAAETFLNWHFFENGRGMTISPNMSRWMWMLGQDRSGEYGNDKGPVTNFIEKRYGFNVDKNDKLIGVFNVKYKNMDVGVLSCTACHSGKAAGLIIPGLGNKTIDAHKVGKDNQRIMKFWSRGKKGSEYRYISDKARYFAKVTADESISNLTRGLVSDSTIKTFFYKDQGLPYPKNMGRAQVKVPHLWGIKEKRLAGIFNDGSLSGDNYAWIFGAELMGSDSGDHLRAVLPKIEWLTEKVLANLLPPAYPFKIEENRAARGKIIFENTCIKCHGDHDRDQNGYPLYTTPKVIKKEVVKTDEDKLESISDEFINLVNTSSLRDLLSFKEENIRKGYFAPKLWGIWSRFPYLHNGSVPTLYHLLLPQKERPEVFSMYQAGEKHRFDSVNLGLTLIEKGKYNNAVKKAIKGDRDLYYVKREGQSNRGHYFKKFSALTHNDRMDLIEYLKTL